MPRTIVFPDPAGASSIGAGFSVTRVGAGAAGVRAEVQLGNGDPDGPFVTTAAALTGASQTALVTVLNELIALARAARNYT